MGDYDYGLIGLAVMGENLVLNIERNGFSVAVYNRTTSVKDEFVARPAAGKKIGGADDTKGFVAKLKRPRKIQIMVKAGAPVDAVIQQLVPFLEAGGLVIERGDRFF